MPCKKGWQGARLATEVVKHVAVGKISTVFDGQIQNRCYVFTAFPLMGVSLGAHMATILAIKVTSQVLLNAGHKWFTFQMEIPPLILIKGLLFTS